MIQKHYKQTQLNTHLPHLWLPHDLATGTVLVGNFAVYCLWNFVWSALWGWNVHSHSFAPFHDGLLHFLVSLSLHRQYQPFLVIIRQNITSFSCSAKETQSTKHQFYNIIMSTFSWWNEETRFWGVVSFLMHWVPHKTTQQHLKKVKSSFWDLPNQRPFDLNPIESLFIFYS